MSYFTKDDKIKIIRILVGDMEIYDDSEFSTKLFEYYLNDMPYGTAKGRDGDPDEWIFERLNQEYDYLLSTVELTKEDLANV